MSSTPLMNVPLDDLRRSCATAKYLSIKMLQTTHRNSAHQEGKCLPSKTTDVIKQIAHLVRKAEPYFLVHEIDNVQMLQVSFFREAFKEFVFVNLGLEKQVTEQLFNYVEKPEKGGLNWLNKCHRRVLDLLSHTVQTFVRKTKTSCVDGHACYSILYGFLSMGSQGSFVRELEGNPGSVTSFLGMEKPTFGSDVRILKLSTEKQVYCKAFVDDSSGVELLGFESSTNLFKQGINLFDHCCGTLRKTFYGSRLLTDIITSAEDNPQAHGGLYDLLESIKIALTTEEFNGVREEFLKQLHCCASYLYGLIKTAPFWVIVDVHMSVDFHNKSLFNLFSNDQGQPRSRDEFLQILSNLNLFGYFYKIIYLLIILRVETRNPKDMESLAHDNEESPPIKAFGDFFMDEVFDCLDIEGGNDGDLNYQKLRFLFDGTYERFIQTTTVWTTTGVPQREKNQGTILRTSIERSDEKSLRNERMMKQIKDSRITELRSAVHNTGITSPPAQNTLSELNRGSISVEALSMIAIGHNAKRQRPDMGQRQSQLSQTSNGNLYVRRHNSDRNFPEEEYDNGEDEEVKVNDREYTSMSSSSSAMPGFFRDNSNMESYTRGSDQGSQNDRYYDESRRTSPTRSSTSRSSSSSSSSSSYLPPTRETIKRTASTALWTSRATMNATSSSSLGNGVTSISAAAEYEDPTLEGDQGNSIEDQGDVTTTTTNASSSRKKRGTDNSTTENGQAPKGGRGGPGTRGGRGGAPRGK